MKFRYENIFFALLVIAVSHNAFADSTETESNTLDGTLDIGVGLTKKGVGAAGCLLGGPLVCAGGAILIVEGSRQIIKGAEKIAPSKKKEKK